MPDQAHWLQAPQSLQIRATSILRPSMPLLPVSFPSDKHAPSYTPLVYHLGQVKDFSYTLQPPSLGPVGLPAAPLPSGHIRNHRHPFQDVLATIDLADIDAAPATKSFARVTFYRAAPTCCTPMEMIMMGQFQSRCTR